MKTKTKLAALGRKDHAVVKFQGQLIPVLGVVGGTKEQSRETAKNIDRYFAQKRGGAMVQALLLVIIVLALVGIGLAFEIHLTRNVIRENNASVEEQQARRVQYLQTNAAQRAVGVSPADQGGAK